MLQEPAIKKDNDLFTDVLDNLPDKYFFDKGYKSKSQVDKNMDNAINHFIDLKYNRSEAQELATKLEKQSKNADDFVMSYEEYPTKEQNDKGYKSKSDFTKTIKKGITILKGKQYSKDEAQEAVNYIAEHSSKLDFDKNIDKLPDIKNYRKGYKTDDEISDCFNNSIEKLVDINVPVNVAEMYVTNLQRRYDKEYVLTRIQNSSSKMGTKIMEECIEKLGNKGYDIFKSMYAFYKLMSYIEDIKQVISIVDATPDINTSNTKDSEEKRILSVDNPYEILGLTKQASTAEVRKAFLNLSKKYHPDKSKTDTTYIFQKINQAYQTIK